MNTSQSEEESLIEYPSDFPIKVMGKAEPDLVEALTAIVLEFDPSFNPATIERLTFTVRATSRPQLDGLYRALHAHPAVSVVL
jgi:putative lipoic acid-binding regulatory protein